MAPVRNGRHLFNSAPSGYPIPGETTVYDGSQTIDLENVPLNGGFLLKHLALSIDPYMRGRMRPTHSSPFKLHEPLNNFGVGLVIRSDNPAIKAGDHLYGYYTFEEYSVRTDAEAFRKIDGIANIPWSAFVGVAGMPGKTAYYGYKEFYQPKMGDVVFVSGGAGAVGSLVVQLAKLDGVKVIASAGSEDKVEFMKGLGVDVAFNYKTTNTLEVLQREGPISMYWDNVGGETLEAALEAAAKNAVIIECGMISGYNGASYHVKNLMLIVTKRLRIMGLGVVDWEDKYGKEFYATVPDLVASGKLKHAEDVRIGLEDVGQAFLDVQTGKNTGKLVIKVADD